MADLDLTGAHTALATPFNASGSEVDWASFDKLLEAQLKARVSGVVPCGTTGEAPTLSDAEKVELIARTVRIARGKAKVTAGTGSNDTKKTIEATRAAFDAGVDAALVVMPYYSRPSQEGLLRHLTMVAQAVPGPIVLYSVPARSAVDLEVETVLRLLDLCPNVVAIKDASGGLLFCQELLARAGDRITVLCGDDALALPMLSVGVKGVISVTSNVYPRAVSEVFEHALAGKWAEAKAMHRALYPVHRAMFLEPSPAPVKAALVNQGIIGSGTLRPPLVEASATCRGRLAELMATFGATA
jgi:4-hydroxy-tetrahydrodipicolinate synthase